MQVEKQQDEQIKRAFALLIDGENVSPKYISGIIREMTSRYGILTYRRIYGDFTKAQKNGWKDVLLDNSITPIQQYSNTIGKNSSDSALIIDAMDILYTEKVDGFCIVSSDSDFTRLASRLRESHMYVIVMGEDKTPRSIRNACDKFIALENLLDQDDDDKKTFGRKETTTKKLQQTLSKTTIIQLVNDIITDNENSGRLTHLGELGSKIDAQFPDFDTRDYGYSSLSKFVEEAGFRLNKINTAFYVSIKSETAQKDVIVCAKRIIGELGAQGIGIGELSNRLHAEFPSFSPKTYGYSQFQKFVNAIPDVVLFQEGAIKKVRNS